MKKKSIIIRLRRKLFRFLYGKGSPRLIQIRYGRLKLKIMSDSPMAELLFSGVGFEEREMKYINSITKPGDIVMDVGANVGIYTLFFSNLVGMTGHVWSFEPSPLAVSILRENVAMNFLKNVSVVEKLLADKIGPIEFYIFDNTGDVYNSIGASERPVEEIKASKAIIMKSYTLDAFADENKIKKINIIKIDVEGAEELVLRGGVGLLEKSDKLIVLSELYEPSLTQCGCSVESLVSFMRSIGFSCWEIKENGSLRGWEKYHGGTSYVVFKKDDE